MVEHADERADLVLRARRDTNVEIAGAETRFPGGMKIAVFPFSPTSERIAEWLYRATDEAVSDERVKTVFARVYETQLPTEAIAEYRP